MSLYEQVFSDLCDSLRRTHPHTADFLRSMIRVLSLEEACNVGFMFLYLNSWQETAWMKARLEVTQANLRDFIFFEETKENKQALAQFEELLCSYQKEASAIRSAWPLAPNNVYF